MKNILSSLNEYEKKRILEMHYRASQRQYLAENPTGTTPTTTTTQTTTPGDPSQSTVDLSTIMSELKSACNTFNTEITNKTKLDIGDKGLTTMVLPEGMIAEGPYITITSAMMQDVYGTSRPYGHIGVELSKGYYGINWQGTGIVKGVTLENFILGAQNLIGYIARDGVAGSDKGKNFLDKHREAIRATLTTLFNTVDPIFKKLLAYKGYNSATTDGGKVTVSKTV